MLLPLVLLSCTTPPTAGLLLLDEGGAPLAGGWAEVDGERLQADGEGRVSGIVVDRPRLVLAGGPDVLTEPFALGPDDAAAPVPVTLLRAAGRRTLHFGGDVMFGRRYQAGEAPLVPADDAAAGARRVVADLAPAFALADVSTVNLETVVGEDDPTLAYPGKRWLLSTPADALAGLDALGVDVVALGNNHQYDWQQPGVAATLAALAGRGLPATGGGGDAGSAAAPVVVEVDGLRIGTLSWTSVDGTWVNDQYPDDGDAVPDDLADEDAWLVEARRWGWTSADGAVSIETADRRIGGAWRRIAAVEGDLDEAARGDLWASARAVYPELQDWVARRGHGGAAPWHAEDSPARVRALREQVDVVVVQLHMGFQFCAAPGDGAREAARDAIDAGADLVVMHHPHVLQGVEWYRDGLVAWSLGNLVFDQDFLVTFPSAMLRVVWDEDEGLVEARLVPLWLDGYRPTPVAGDLAREALAALREPSLNRDSAARGPDGVVRVIGAPPEEEGWAPATLTPERNTLRISRGAPEVTALALPPGTGLRDLGGPHMVRVPVEGAAGLELGRSLLPFGGFEDDDTDATLDDIGWARVAGDATLSDRDAARGARSLLLIGQPGVGGAMVRTGARLPLPTHRRYADAEGVTPLDPPAAYALRLAGRLDGEPGLALARLDLYHFDDLDPTRAPSSALLRQVELTLPLEDGAWQEVAVGLAPEHLAPVDGLAPNMAMLYLGVREPARRTTAVMLDDVDLVELRAADAGGPGWQRVDHVRGGAAVAPEATTP